ncbi:MAG: methylenetetrahydrofolate reductase [Spirochaetales bacterium]|nr:methylenetetrahydrofolate reductase [Spirochaetales bacterium]
MNSLMERIKKRESGLILYGLTPPKAINDDEKNERISQRRISRIREINVDGIVLYDIQDEASRTSEERPFPFIPTVDPWEYKRKFFTDLDLPTIFYQCVGKYTPEEMAARMDLLKDECAVFVGSSSRSESVKCSLREAYRLAGERDDLYLGGVTIPERHLKNRDEHLRLIRKQDSGVNFFISQFIFNIEKAKDMVSDYFYTCRAEGREVAPLFFTLTPCGSERTVNLLEWLGVSIPVWIKNELIHSDNTLELSLDLCMNALAEMSSFCLKKGIPFGCNVESASVRKDEVLASFELARLVEDKFKALGLR